MIANTASEHDQIGAIHQTRIAAFPAHHSYGWSTVFPPSFPHKDVDILFTGQAFTPTMRDKAQFLFRLATIDRAGARIAIHDDFLEDEKYVTSLASAKFVTTYLRYTGGVQTRATDALRRSALVLSNDQDWAAGRLGGALDGLICVDPAAPEGDILARLDGQDGGSAPGPGRPALDKGFGQFFWPSPARESRFLKFCFFQTLLADGKGAPGGEGAGAIPVELGGYSPERGVGVYSAISKANLAAPRKTPAHMNFAGAAAFYGAILLKDNQKMGRMALKIFRAGLEAFPDALAMRFNYARALWLFGIKVEACAQFEQVASDQAAQFDAWRDALLSHRVQPLAEMFPYGDYYRATARALGRGDGDFSEARRMIRGGARSFLGLAAMEQGRERPALDHLRGAIADCPINFPAYRLLCVGLARQREQGAELLDAFYRAVNLYPPYLSELLPIGVAAEINRGRDGAALELIRKWIMFQLRRLDGKGMPFPVPAQSLETALHYRGRLEHWTAEALALIVAENSTVGPLPMA